MKTLFDILRTVFLITGAIIGAGFITGAELVGFFGAKDFIYCIILATVLITFVLSVVFIALKKSSHIENNSEKLMGGKVFYTISTCFSSLIFTASMLAGIDALLNTVIDLKIFQFGSIIVMVFINIFAKYGVKGLEKLNLFLIPIIIVVVNILIFTRQEVIALNIQPFTAKKAIKATLYVFMNIFLCFPVMRETAKNKSLKMLVVVSIIVAVLVGLQAFVILNAIRSSPESANMDMPLYFALFNGGFSALYFYSTILCAITSAFSAYYPLYTFSKEKSKKIGTIVCSLIILLVAKLGLTQIVKYAYPVVGGLGGLLLVKSLTSIKSKTYADNNDKNLKMGEICQKTRKIK